MKIIREMVEDSPLILMISILVASSAFHPALGITSSWIVATGQLAFLPLLLYLSLNCFPSIRRSFLIRAMSLELFIAIPLHVALLFALMYFPQLATTQENYSTWMGTFVAVFREEVTKIIPVLLLYRSLTREPNARTAMAVGFFSGLVFGCFENIATSSAYDFSGNSDASFVANLILYRVLFWSVVHAMLTATSAHLLMNMNATQNGRFVLRLLFALGVASILHCVLNVVPGYKVGIAFILAVVFSTLYANSSSSNAKNPA